MTETENKKILGVPQISLSEVSDGEKKEGDDIEELKVALKIEGLKVPGMPCQLKLMGSFYYPFGHTTPSYDMVPQTLLKLKNWLTKDGPMPTVVPEDVGGKRTDKHLEACVYAAYTCYPFHPPGSREQFITLIHAITFVFVDDIVEFIVKFDAEDSSQFLEEIEGTMVQILEGGSRVDDKNFIMEKAGKLASSLKYPNLNYYYSLVYRLHKRMSKWLPVYNSDRGPTILCLKKYFESFKWVKAANDAGHKISLNIFRQIRRFDGNAGAAIELSAQTLGLILSPLHRLNIETYIDYYSQAILFINDIMGIAHELKSLESCPQHGTNLVLKYYRLGYSIEEAFSKAIGIVNELLEDMYLIGNILTQNIFPGDAIMKRFVEITRATTRGIYDYQKMSQFRYGSSTPKEPNSEITAN